MAGGVLPFIVRRLLLVPPTLFAVLIITFAFTQAAPGDPVRIITGVRQPDPVVAERIREDLGLNGNFFERFGDYTWNLVTEGDLGPSYFHRSPQRSVDDLLGERIWISAQLGLLSLALILLIGVPLGVYAALHRGTWRDPFAIAAFMMFDAVPIIVLMPLLTWLLVFALDDVLSVVGLHVPSVWTPGDAASYLIPVIAMTLPGLAGMGRFVRVSVLSVIDQDYVRTARAKGLPERIIIRRHVLRNALLPLATVMGLAVVGVVSGSILVETLYGVPGVGAFLFESINTRDFNVILGFTLFVAALFALSNVVIDVAYVFIDPRVRQSRRVL